MENMRTENTNGDPVPDEAAILSHFFEIVPALLCVTTAEGNLLKTNHLWETVLGYRPKDIAGCNFSDFAYRDDAEPTRAFLAGLRENGRDSVFVNRFGRRGGGYRSLEWHARLSGDLIYAAARDITEQRRAVATAGPDLFGELFNSCPAIMCVTNLEDRRITAVNPAFVEALGYSGEDVIGRTAEELHLYGDQDGRRAIPSPPQEKDGFQNVHKTLVGKQGRVIECLCSGVIFEDRTGRSVFMVMLDITAIRESERAKEKQAEMLSALVDSMPEVVFYKNTDGVYIGCNPSCAALLGKSKEEVIGKTDFELFDRHTAERIKKGDEKVCASRNTMTFEEWLCFGEGNKMLRETLKAPYIDPAGNLIGIIGISHDITKRKRREEEIRYLSFHDQLTGLYNRRFYEEELQRIDVDRSLPITVIMGDVNSLKFVNDAFGHREGDALIAQVAHAIKQSCRTEDIVARTGGDEFSLVLPLTNFITAQNVLRRISAALSDVKAGIVSASVSFGVATKISGEQNIQDIIKKAEDRMYRNKLDRRSAANGKAIDIIINTLYEKSEREKEHSQRVGRLCEQIAAGMALDSETIQRVKLAGIMHDIGKIELDDTILNKQTALSERERELINYHPEHGYRILSTAKEFSEIALYVYEHHENWDGSGYPKGLRAEEILLPARIIAVAEAYDAMANPIYKAAMSREEIVAEVTRCAGTRFDSAVVKVFLGMCLD